MKTFNRDNFLGGGLLLYAGGLFLLIQGVLVLGMGFGQAGWVATTAVVTESRTSTSYSQERTRTNYHFQYEYTVDGELFQSRRYSAAQLSPSEIQGVRQFNEGEQIPIFYNPAKPKQAVVVRRSPSLFVYFGMLLGGFFLVFATSMTFPEPARG